MIHLPEFAGEKMTEDEAAERWENTTQLHEASELIALWLHGKTPYAPGTSSDSPDTETSPIIPDLVQLNRLGFWTDGSQPGGRSAGGVYCRAYVFGYTDLVGLVNLRSAEATSDLLMISRPADESPPPAALPDPIPLERHGSTLSGGHELRLPPTNFAEEEGGLPAELWEGLYVVGLVDAQWGRTGYLWETASKAMLRADLERHR